MVICAIVGCSNTSKRTLGVSFYRLPAIILHQGEKTKELSQKRQDLWLSRIHRDDLGEEKCPNTRVCGLHFVLLVQQSVCAYNINGQYVQ